MSTAVWLIAFFLAGAVAAMAWTMSQPLPEEVTFGRRRKIEDLLPLHTQHFPQLRQSLDSTDERYIHRRASEVKQRMWRAERRQILQGFLAGLAGDFARLNRLTDVIASLSPRGPKHEKLKRSWLCMRFRLHYRIISAQTAAGGSCSMRGLARMTGLVASLSARAETAMTQTGQESAADRVSSNFTA